MERLNKVKGHYLTFSDYGIQEKFDIYELDSYEFDENLDFGDSAGVYIFTRRDVNAELNPSYQKHMYSHTLIYCGMTKELDSRFYAHFRKEEIIFGKVSSFTLCRLITEPHIFLAFYLEIHLHQLRIALPILLLLLSSAVLDSLTGNLDRYFSTCSLVRVPISFIYASKGRLLILSISNLPSSFNSAIIIIVP